MSSSPTARFPNLTVVLWIPGAIVNPGQSGWPKHARLANSIRERVAMHVLITCGRRPPWPVAAPKLVTFRAYVYSLFDDDNLRTVLKPYRDGLMDCGMFSPRTLVTKPGKHFGKIARGHGDGPEHGHRYVYDQVVARGKDAARGLEIEVTLA